MIDAFKTNGSSPPDIHVENHRSLYLLRPAHDRAGMWLRDHVAEDAQWFGNALVVEPRYVADIVNGSVQAGLEVA